MNYKKTILISLFAIGILFLTSISIVNAAITIDDSCLSGNYIKNNRAFSKTNGTYDDWWSVSNDPIWIRVAGNRLNLKAGSNYSWHFQFEDDICVLCSNKTRYATIHWGDGFKTTHEWSHSGGYRHCKDFSHKYANPGRYTIKVDTKDNGGLTSNLSFDVYVYTRYSPSITVIPSSQNGNPGEVKTYEIKITNDDTSYAPSSTYTATTYTGCSSGWSCTWASNKTTLTLSPGSSGSLYLNVQPPSNASTGNHTVEIKVTRTSINDSKIPSSYTSTESYGPYYTSFVYNVSPSCVRNTPTISVSPEIKSGEKGGVVAFKVDVVNNDTNCSERKINLSVENNAGLGYSFSITSFTNNSGGSSDLTFTIPSNSSYTTYSPSIKATNAYNTSKSSSKSVSIKVAEISDIQIKDSSGNIIQSPNDWDYNLPFNSKINVSWKTKNISSSRVRIWLDRTSDVQSFTVDTSLGSGSINFTLPVAWTVGKTGKIIIEGTLGVSRIREFKIVSPCTRNAPTISVNPTTVTGKLEGRVSFNVTVINNDTNCSNSSVNLSVSNYGNLTLDQNLPITINSFSANGSASSTLTFKIPSSPDAYDSYVNIPIVATNANDVTKTSSVNVTIKVAKISNVQIQGLTNSNWNLNDPKTISFTAKNIGSVYIGYCPTGSSGCYALIKKQGGTDLSNVSLSSLTKSGDTYSVDAYINKDTLVNTQGVIKVKAMSDSNGTDISSQNISSDSGIIYIKPSCTPKVPTISVSPLSVTGKPEGSVSFEVNVTNNDDANNCSNRKIILSVENNNDLTYSFSSSSLSDSGGKSILTFKIPSDSLYTTYSPFITAKNANNTDVSSSKSVTINVAKITSVSISGLEDADGDGYKDYPIGTSQKVIWGSRNVNNVKISACKFTDSGLINVQCDTLISNTTSSTGASSYNFSLSWPASTIGYIKVEDINTGAYSESAKFKIMPSSDCPSSERKVPLISLGEGETARKIIGGENGKTQTFRLSIKNQDGTSCSLSTIKLEVSAGDGALESKFSSSELSLSSNSSQEATLTFTVSDASKLKSNYEYTITARNTTNGLNLSSELQGNIKLDVAKIEKIWITDGKEGNNLPDSNGNGYLEWIKNDSNIINWTAQNINNVEIRACKEGATLCEVKASSATSPQKISLNWNKDTKGYIRVKDNDTGIYSDKKIEIIDSAYISNIHITDNNVTTIVSSQTTPIIFTSYGINYVELKFLYGPNEANECYFRKNGVSLSVSNNTPAYISYQYHANYSILATLSLSDCGVTDNANNLSGKIVVNGYIKDDYGNYTLVATDSLGGITLKSLAKVNEDEEELLSPSISNVQIEGFTGSSDQWLQGETRRVNWSVNGNVSQIKRYICTKSIGDKKEKCYYWTNANEALANNPPMDFKIGYKIDQNLSSLNPVSPNDYVLSKKEDLYNSSWYVKIVDANDSSVFGVSTSFQIPAPISDVQAVKLDGSSLPKYNNTQYKWGSGSKNAIKITWKSKGISKVKVLYCVERTEYPPTNGGCWTLYSLDGVKLDNLESRDGITNAIDAYLASGTLNVPSPDGDPILGEIIIKGVVDNFGNDIKDLSKQESTGKKIRIIGSYNSPVIKDVVNCNYPADLDYDCMISSEELNAYTKRYQAGEVSFVRLQEAIAFYNALGYHKDANGNFVSGVSGLSSSTSRLDSVKNQLAAISEALSSLYQKISGIGLFGR
ncbi:MAG TPA: hypothetical protein PLE40_01085 [Candidatus Pacearchaeota archaeon]|nr:hypothetical protein [Candidatus Pacearchaeota archaeon]